MGFFSSLDISASGLTAQRMRMDVISQNIANAQSTRTEEGGTYRRRVTVMAEKADKSFQHHLHCAISKDKGMPGKGVDVVEVIEDTSDFKLVYDPTHPDADEEGYVAYPNVDELVEIVDMMAATRAYEANITALNAAKAMAVKALEIGK